MGNYALQQLSDTEGQAKTEMPRVPAKVLRDDPNMQKKEEKKLAKQNVPQRSSTTKKVALFNHLKQYDRNLKHLSELPSVDFFYLCVCVCACAHACCVFGPICQ